jgi:hypothetical protein
VYVARAVRRDRSRRIASSFVPRRLEAKGQIARGGQIVDAMIVQVSKQLNSRHESRQDPKNRGAS